MSRYKKSLQIMLDKYADGIVNHLKENNLKPTEKNVKAYYEGKRIMHNKNSVEKMTNYLLTEPKFGYAKEETLDEKRARTARQLLEDIRDGKSVSRWDVYGHRKLIYGIMESESEFATNEIAWEVRDLIDSAKLSS